MNDHPNLHFWHRGECGDILYSWFFISFYGPARFTTKGPSNHGTFDQYEALRELAIRQPYLKSFAKNDVHTSDMEDLRKWIDGGAHTDGPNIIKPYFKGTATTWPGYMPWLFGVEWGEPGYEYTVINRTFRARDTQMRWGEYLPAGELRFIGLESEYTDFRHHLEATGYGDAAMRMRHFWTKDLFDAARQISGAKAFYGNTSACLALAQGMGKQPIYVEADPHNANTSLFGHEVVLNRSNIPWLVEIASNS